MRVRRWWEVGSSPQHGRPPRVLAAVSRAWQLYGPFDAVAGFSEGGAVAHMVAMAAANQTDCSDSSGMPSGSTFSSLRAAVFFAAFCPDGSPELRLSLPSLHVFSEADTAVTAGRSTALADLYSLAALHTHADGHCVPMRAKDLTALRSFLLQVSAALCSQPGPSLPSSHVSETAYSIPTAQAEEQEALASIFESDYTRVTSNPVQCQIAIGWRKVSSAARAETLVPWIFLLFTLNARYLSDALGRPALRLCTKERNAISSAHETSILNVANQAIDSCGGEPAIFAATSAARDWIDLQLPDGPDSASALPVADLSVADAHAVPALVNSWWEVEDIDMSEVLSAGAAAGSVSFQFAAGKEAGAASFANEWKLIVGLVGKPSSGKSTFFNAACRPANIESAARMAAHPFTTIEPNIGHAFAALPCPCSFAELSHGCSPLHGHAELPGTRRAPVMIKDVAGLVPGAYQGKGRGNAFLNDLVNCDVLIHVVDASGKTTSSGTEGEGDPRHDIDWVVRKTHFNPACECYFPCFRRLSFDGFFGIFCRNVFFLMHIM